MINQTKRAVVFMCIGLLVGGRSGVEGVNRRGRPLGRWEDKVKEYVSERE